MRAGMFLAVAGAVLLSGCCTAASPLAAVRDNGIIEMKSGNYELSFFPGCMFPFRLKCGGRTLPEPVWLDRLVAEDGKQYFLNIERFAERRIVSSTDREFCVEMTGTYCLNDDVSCPGKVQAVYRYTCRPDGVDVAVRISNPEGLSWKEVHVLMPGWKDDPWEKFVAADPLRKVNKQGFLTDRSVSAVGADGTITVYGGKVTGYTNPGKKYYSYLAAFRGSHWHDAVLEINDLKLKLTANAEQ